MRRAMAMGASSICNVLSRRQQPVRTMKVLNMALRGNNKTHYLCCHGAGATRLLQATPFSTASPVSNEPSEGSTTTTPPTAVPEGTVKNQREKGPLPPENIWFMEKEYMDTVDPEKKEGVDRLLSVNTASKPEELRQRVAKAVAKWRRHEADVGSPAASIAAMSERIKYLHKHMRANHKDKHSMYGIHRLINKRRYMLKYLAKKDFQAFKGLVNEYEISSLELMTDQGASHRGWTERNARRRAKRGKRRFPPYHHVE